MSSTCSFLLILVVVFDSAFFLLSTGVSRSVLECIRKAVNYCNELRISNHPLTIYLGSLFLSHTYVNEDAILFEKKQQEQKQHLSCNNDDTNTRHEWTKRNLSSR